MGCAYPRAGLPSPNRGAADSSLERMTMIQTLIISGMNCQHCVRAVSDALSAVEGVDSVEVDLDAGCAKVEGRADAAALIAAVVAAGYAAEPSPAA